MLGQYAAAPEAADSKQADAVDTSLVDEEILEELRMMYPDAGEEHLLKAACSSNVDEAFDVLQSLMSGMEISTGEVNLAANMDQLKQLKAFFTPADGGISPYDDNDLTALLAGFHGDAGACCGIAMAEPHLIELMLRDGCTIDEAVSADAAEQDRLRRQQEIADAFKRAAEISERKKVEEQQRSLYLPPTVPQAKWKECGHYLLSLATPNTREPGWTGKLEQGEVPRCWDGTHGVVTVPPGQEFTAAAHYVSAVLGYQPEIRGIVRVQNYQDFGIFRSNKGNTIMFHGCRGGSGGEKSIAMTGFQTSKCQSDWHGNGKGSWFAYQSNYSDRGFVFEDAQGLRHIFLCIVSTCEVLLDNETMRVVGQACAVPLWIVTYSRKGQFRELKHP